MTFAPEVEGAKEALETYKDDIIFQLVIQWQHTKKQLKLLSEELNMSRILYNAATPFQHREPGVLGQHG